MQRKKERRSIYYFLFAIEMYPLTLRIGRQRDRSPLQLRSRADERKRALLRVERSRQTDRLIARAPMRQHDSEISRGTDPFASLLSRSRKRVRASATTIGSRVAPTSAGAALDRRWRYRGRQSRVVGRVARYCFTLLSRAESTRVYPRPSRFARGLTIIDLSWESPPRVNVVAKFRRRQSCTILSWPGEGVKFRPDAP